MYVLPVQSSGQESFDREAQRAIGVASPFPVPRDNGAYELVRGTVVEVTPPKK
jgi:outer membrane biosynthesis protein TonB